MDSYSKYKHEAEYSGTTKDLLIEEILIENLAEVKRLMEQVGADPNTVVPERGAAPFHLIAGTANEDFGVAATTVALLAAGGDPNVRSEEGLTPVHVAAAWGRGRVLELLLSNGGDPALLDYYHLDAEDYALRGRHWVVFAMIATHSPSDVELRGRYTGERRPAKVQRDVSCADDANDDSSWLSNFSDMGLDRNAVQCIRKHRRKTKVYEYPTPTDNTEVSAPPRRNVNNLLNEKAMSVIRDHWERRAVNEGPSKKESDFANERLAAPRLPKKRRDRRTESEMYVCEFAEASYETRELETSTQTSVGTRSATSDLEKRQANKMLCRMSRIFLFMLKKRSVYQKLK